jgi:hypothetical protein
LWSSAFWTTRRNLSAHISLAMGTTRDGPKRQNAGPASLRTGPRIARTRSSARNSQGQKLSNTTNPAEVTTYLREFVWPQFWCCALRSSGMLHCVAGWFVLHSTGPPIWRFICYLCCSVYCLCVNVYCLRVSSRLQLINISYIVSYLTIYHIISYIIHHIVSYIVS